MSDPAQPTQVENQASETSPTTPPEPMGVPESAASASPPSPSSEPSEGFFARLANAWKGFWQGWRGELLEIPSGEEGTVPLGQLRAIERKLEKKLAKAEAGAEQWREDSAIHKKQLAERDAELKEASRELKRLRAGAEETEKALQSDLAKLQDRLEKRDATIATLEGQVAAHAKTIAERDESLAGMKRDLQQAREEAVRQLEASARELQQARADAQRQESAVRGEAEATQSQLRSDLTASEDAIKQLRTQLEQTNTAHAATLASLKKELDIVREALANKEAASELLLTEVSNHESAAEQANEDAQRAQAELREEIERLEAQLKSSEQAKEKLRSELIAALPEKVAAADLRVKVTVAEKDYARKAEEADLLREDLREARRRLAEYESKVGGLEETEGKRASLQREFQRQSAQLDAVRSQLEDSRLFLERLRSAVQEFHGTAVSTIQVAGVYAETVSGSLALSESDRADIIEIKQNMDALRVALQKLASKLAEGGSTGS